MEQNSTTGSRNIMPFKMAGSEKMRIDTLGNVGIGTSAPSYLLDVYGGSGRISTPSNDGTLYLGTSTVQYKNSTNTICLGAASINTAAATGTNNLAIGNASMGSVSSGSNNTACGNTALTGTTLGSNNTGVGFSAGSGITSGTGNVYVGAASVASSGGANNEIVIGAGAVGIGNNSVVLGNDNIVTTSLNGNVGIKTKLPAAVLDVNGAVKFRGALDMTNQNISGVGSLTITGNVGIGTSTPSYKHHVYGSLTNGVVSTIENASSDSSSYAQFILKTDQTNTFSIFKNSSTRTNDGGVNTTTIRNDGGKLRLQNNSGDDGITISGANVGIGTSTPGYTLDVNGIVKTKNPCLLVAGNQNTNVTSNSGEKLKFNSILIDTHNGFSTTDYVYTVPRSGYYLIGANIYLNSAGRVSLVAGSNPGTVFVNGSASTQYAPSIIYSLSQGNTIYLESNSAGLLYYMSATNPHTYMYIYMIG
jgi:hypothetical protein